MIEIEKKFLLREDGQEFVTAAFVKEFGSIEKLLKTFGAQGVTIQQGYLPEGKFDSVLADLDTQIPFAADEVRLRRKGDFYFLTAKSSGGLERSEFETKTCKLVFESLWSLTEGRRVEKIRYEVLWWFPKGNLTFEFDNYTDGRDLLVCEVELPSVESAEHIEPLGKDVTEDEKYRNKNLAK